MGPAKDKHGVLRESFAEVHFYFAKNEWPFPVERNQINCHTYSDILTFCLIYGILSGISGARCQDFTVEKQGTEADKLDRKIDSIGFYRLDCDPQTQTDRLGSFETTGRQKERQIHKWIGLVWLMRDSSGKKPPKSKLHDRQKCKWMKRQIGRREGMYVRKN